MAPHNYERVHVRDAASAHLGNNYCTFNYITINVESHQSFPRLLKAFFNCLLSSNVDTSESRAIVAPVHGQYHRDEQERPEYQPAQLSDAILDLVRGHDSQSEARTPSSSSPLGTNILVPSALHGEALLSAERRRCSFCQNGRPAPSQTRLSWFGGTLLLRYHACKRCTRSVTEATFRLPGWLAQSNICISGPERLLRVQRRVPWGSEESVLKYCLTGNYDGVKELILDRRASLYDVDPNHGWTPLHYAVQKNNIPILKFLLSVGADPDFEDYNGITVKYKAWEHILTHRGSQEDLSQLRHIFPSLDEDEQCFTHLHCIVVGERPIKLTELTIMQYKEQLGATDSMGRTPLHWACDRGDSEVVSRLIDAGAEVELKDLLGLTPLILGAASGNEEVINKLLHAGAQPNVFSNKGDSPLIFASRYQPKVAPVKTLIGAGARVNHKNNLRNTALTAAAIMNRCEIGRYLIGVDANVHTQGKYLDTPLFETIYHNSHEFLQMLLERSASTMYVNRNGTTILHAVAFEGDTETARILRDADVHLPSKSAKNNAVEDVWQVLGKRSNPPEGFVEMFKELLEQAE